MKSEPKNDSSDAFKELFDRTLGVFTETNTWMMESFCKQLSASMDLYHETVSSLLKSGKDNFYTGGIPFRSSLGQFQKTWENALKTTGDSLRNMLNLYERMSGDKALNAAFISLLMDLYAKQTELAVSGTKKFLQTLEEETDSGIAGFTEGIKMLHQNLSASVEQTRIVLENSMKDFNRQSDFSASAFRTLNEALSKQLALLLEKSNTFWDTFLADLKSSRGEPKPKEKDKKTVPVN